MQGTRERFDYHACAECGGLQIEKLPDSLDRFYPPDYYTSRQRGMRLPGRAMRTLRGAWSRLRLSKGPLVRALSGRRHARFDWFRKTGTRPADAILDVGCGSGRLLYRLAREGFTDLTGIDPRLQGAKGDTPSIRFLRASPEEHVGQYRLVMAHHSFEHMRDPAAAFAAMARLVARGGHLLLRVPLADGWAARHYGPDWVQLDAPRHLHLPTRRSVEKLAQRSGLRVVEVVDDSGPFQIWGSELYRRDRPLSGSGRRGARGLPLVVRIRARREARRLARSGQGDQACFYLRRD